MSLRFVLAVLLAVLAPGAAQAQEAALDRVGLRLISTRPVVIDRGSRDGVELGDAVLLFPRDGGTQRGVVTRLDERSSVVELNDQDYAPVVGTKGEVLVPRGRQEARLEEEERRLQAEAEARANGDATGEGPEVEGAQGDEPEGSEHPPWRYLDESFTAEMPLLAQVKALRPEQRHPLVTGRIYSIGDSFYSTEDDRTDLFYRVGTDYLLENPFGRGGGFRFDGEASYRRFDSDASLADDEDDFEFRIDRLSYYEGGTRFQYDRWEAGRFLQHGLPEFGVVDGVEWNRRRTDGNRYGLSVGYMPEPNADYQTGEDLQVAAYYEWVDDEREQLVFTAGYQKSFHNGAADRDLFVTRLRHLPEDGGWSFFGTAFVDLYTGGDNKDAGLELTNAETLSTKTFDNGNTVHVTFSHIRFPDIDRNEFLFSGIPDDIIDQRYDRLAIAAWKPVNDNKRYHAEIGGYLDEHEGGGDLELGVEYLDLWFDKSRADFTIFGSDGRFTWVAGARASYGLYVENGRWDLFYEVSDHHQSGFSNNLDDLVLHRLRASRDFTLGQVWDISLYTEGTLYDDEASWSVGWFVQRSF